MSFEETLDYLYELYNKTYCEDDDDFKTILKNYVENNTKNINNNPSATTDLETFSLSNPHYIKVCRNQIPNGVLPIENVAGFLYDINVYISKEFRLEKRKKFLTDDDVYESFPLIQKNIPRGVTICKIVDKNDDSNIKFYETTIYANKKFTDIPNNNNKNNNLYFLQNSDDDDDDERKIISMEKMNGDALHFSGRYIMGNFYLFVGSKKSHIMIKNESDIELYTDDRYVVSKQFARSVWKMLQNLSPPNRNALYNFLHYTRVTAVCELLQSNYQHIVNISNTADSKVIFLTFTPTFYGLNNKDVIINSLTFLPPHISLRIINVLDIPCAPYKIMIIDNDKKYKEEIENIRLNVINSEGRVFYFLNNKDETIGLLKVKTVWYICLRALREKCVHHFKLKNIDISTVVNSVNTRYTEIQDWLKLSDDIIKYWNNIGEQFIIWLKNQIDKNLINIQQNPIKSNFPNLWDKFNQDFSFA